MTHPIPQDVFNAAFADKLKEFGTIDRLIEEYSAYKLKCRDLQQQLEAAEAALRKIKRDDPWDSDGFKLAYEYFRQKETGTL